MSISYNTSNQNYKVIIPANQEEILAMYQELIPNLYNSYAPIRNNHNFSVLSHDQVHDLYFSDSYDYDRDSIIEYQQIVIINKKDSDSDGNDKFSKFTVDETNKTLTISYNI